MDDILHNALQAGYADAFKALYEEERRKRLEAEALLANTLNYMKLVESQLYQARDERDKLKLIPFPQN